MFFSNVGTVEKNTWHFEVLLFFLSLIYGADLGRSLLVLSQYCIGMEVIGYAQQLKVYCY